MYEQMSLDIGQMDFDNALDRQTDSKRWLKRLKNQSKR